MTMSTTERRLCRDLLITPSSSGRRISKEEFLRQFPSSVEHGVLSRALLADVIEQKNVEDLQCLLIVGHVFGFSTEHVDLLTELVSTTWHVSHEDVVSALNKIGGAVVVDALFRSTQWIPEYLNYDDSRALAVKAIWGLGKIDSIEATEKLVILSHDQEEILRDSASEQLRLRRMRKL